MWGHSYLIDLAANVAGNANLVAYARIVRERSTLRQLIQAATDISRASFNPGALAADELLQMAEKKVLQIAEERPKEGGFIGVNQLLKTTVEKSINYFAQSPILLALPRAWLNWTAKPQVGSRGINYFSRTSLHGKNGLGAKFCRGGHHDSAATGTGI